MPNGVTIALYCTLDGDTVFFHHCLYYLCLSRPCAGQEVNRGSDSVRSSWESPTVSWRGDHELSFQIGFLLCICQVFFIYQFLSSALQVYQDSVYGKDREFISYKKVLFEMDRELAETVQLISFHSLSSTCIREWVLSLMFVNNNFQQDPRQKFWWMAAWTVVAMELNWKPEAQKYSFFKDICNNIILGLSQFSILYNWDIASPAMLHCGPAEVMGPAGAETSGSGGGLQTCAEKLHLYGLMSKRHCAWRYASISSRSVHVKKGCSTPSSQCLHSPSLAWKLAFAVSNIIVYCFLGKRQREKKAYGCILPEMDVA